MELVIREARGQDLTALLGLYKYLHAEEPLQAEGLLALWQSILDDGNYHIFVGELGGRLVSSVTMCVIKNLTRGARPYALIENVVTAADCRGHGYATALLQRAAQCAKAADCYKLMLLTGSKNDATLRFYERAGFNREDKTGFIRWL